MLSKESQAAAACIAMLANYFAGADLVISKQSKAVITPRNIIREPVPTVADFI
jgi:hypothetical protein